MPQDTTSSASAQAVSNQGHPIPESDRQQLLELGALARQTYSNREQVVGKWHPLRLWHPQTGRLSFNGLNRFSSGFQAHAWVNHDQRTIVLAISGTNDVLDVLNWPSSFTGKVDQQVRDAVLAARQVSALTSDSSPYAGYKMMVTGHSLGGELSQVVAYTYGWDGACFDGPGAAAIVHRPVYEDFLKQHAISNSGKAGEGFINLKIGTNHMESGGIVCMAGEPVDGIVRQYYTNGPRIQAVAKVSQQASGLGPWQWFVTRFAGGVWAHNLTTILNDVRNGHVTDHADNNMDLTLSKPSQSLLAPFVKEGETKATRIPVKWHPVPANIAHTLQSVAGNTMSDVWDMYDKAEALAIPAIKMLETTVALPGMLATQPGSMQVNTADRPYSGLL